LQRVLYKRDQGLEAREQIKYKCVKLGKKKHYYATKSPKHKNAQKGVIPFVLEAFSRI